MELSVMEKKYEHHHLLFNNQTESLFTQWSIGYLHYSLNFIYSNSVPYRGPQLGIFLFSYTRWREPEALNREMWSASAGCLAQAVGIYIFWWDIFKVGSFQLKHCQRHSMVIQCSFNPLDSFLLAIFTQRTQFSALVAAPNSFSPPSPTQPQKNEQIILWKKANYWLDTLRINVSLIIQGFAWITNFKKHNITI